MQDYEIPDPNDSWAEVELWRWQYGQLPGNNDMRPLDVAAGLEGMAAAIEKGDEDNFPAPFNVVSALRFAAKKIGQAPAPAEPRGIYPEPERQKVALNDIITIEGMKYRVKGLRKRQLILKALPAKYQTQ